MRQGLRRVRDEDEPLEFLAFEMVIEGGADHAIFLCEFEILYH